MKKLLLTFRIWKAVIAGLPDAKRELTALFIGAAIRTGFAVPIPILVGQLMSNPEGASVSRVLIIGVLLLGLTIAGNITDMLVQRRAVGVATSGSVQWRKRLHEIINRAPMDSLREQGYGGLFDVVGMNVGRVEVAINAIIVIALPAVVLATGLSIFAVFQEWRLVLIGAAFVPLAGFVAMKMGIRNRDAWEAHHYAWADYTEFIMRATRFSKLTKASAAESVEQEQHGTFAEGVRRTSRDAKVLNAMYTALMRSAIAIAGTGVVVVGLAFVAADAMTMGGLAAFVSALALLRQPLQLMIETMPVVNEGIPALHIVQTLESLDLEVAPYESGTKQIELKGFVTAENLAFHYPDSPDLFQNLSFELIPGEITVVIGANGAGKSTMVSLLLGLREPTAGQLTADGIPFQELDMHHIRRQTALLVQELMLDEGSVKDIITYGVRDVPDSQIFEAAKLASASSFIEKLPDGYDTEIGRSGIELSLGQHQRLAIARALARNPKVLLLDEPTNHLDPDAIAEILTNLRALEHPPAILVVTHHADVVEWADHVVHVVPPEQP